MAEYISKFIDGYGATSPSNFKIWSSHWRHVHIDEHRSFVWTCFFRDSYLTRHLSKHPVHRNKFKLIYIYMYVLSVYSPFSDRFRLNKNAIITFKFPKKFNINFYIKMTWRTKLIIQQAISNSFSQICGSI